MQLINFNYWNLLLRYPDVVSRQNLYWDARYIQIDKAYSFPKTKIKPCLEPVSVKKSPNSSPNTSASKKHKLSKNSANFEEVVVKKLRSS